MLDTHRHIRMLPEQVANKIAAGEVVEADAITGLLRVLRAVVNQTCLEGPPVSWPDVWREACRHHLDAYLFAAVLEWPAAQRPPQAWIEQAKSLFLSRAAAAVRIHCQLADVLGALRGAGVAAVPIKGAWLAEHVYADIVQRPMHDIDLLVHPADAPRAGDVLCRLGYRGNEQITPGGWGKDQQFRHPEGRVAVELHWQVGAPDNDLLSVPDTERILGLAVRGVVAGVEMPVLSLATHVVYLIYHILAHHWRFPARAHLDLVLLGRRHASTLTVEALEAEARVWGLGVRAPFVWRVAHDLCGCEPPASLTGWAPQDAAWMVRERAAALAVAMPRTSWRVPMSALLCDYQRASGVKRFVLGMRAVLLPAANLRHAYPRATRWGGWLGGCAARLADLIGRRSRDLLPGCRKREDMVDAVDDMAARLALDRRLKDLEG